MYQLTASATYQFCFNMLCFECTFRVHIIETCYYLRQLDNIGFMPTTNLGKTFIFQKLQVSPVFRLKRDNKPHINVSKGSKRTFPNCSLNMLYLCRSSFPFTEYRLIIPCSISANDFNWTSVDNMLIFDWLARYLTNQHAK